MDNIIFEDNEKRLALELLASDTSANPTTVRAFANAGVITQEGAKELISKMNDSPISAEKEAKMASLHRKALILTAREKNDPLYNQFLEAHRHIESIYEDLESRYGTEATHSEGAIVGKLMSKFRSKSDIDATNAIEHISNFH